MSSPGIQTVNHRHEAIINWLLANPDRKLLDCAEYFGFTQAWLSTIIHSDMFQAAYRKRASELGVAVVHSMKEKIIRLAEVSVDKATSRIEHGQASEKFLGDTLKTSLAALGYGQASNGVASAQSNVHVHIDAASVIRAREEAAAKREGSTPLKIQDGSQIIEADFEVPMAEIPSPPPAPRVNSNPDILSMLAGD